MILIKTLIAFALRGLIAPLCVDVVFYKRELYSFHLPHVLVTLLASTVIYLTFL